MTLPVHKKGCDCALGFFIQENKCISFIEFGSNPGFNSTGCKDFNMVKNSYGQCDCKVGFKRNNQGSCINICRNGFWNGFNCEICRNGTFMREDIRQCESCP